MKSAYDRHFVFTAGTTERPGTGVVTAVLSVVVSVNCYRHVRVAGRSGHIDHLSCVVTACGCLYSSKLMYMLQSSIPCVVVKECTVITDHIRLV